MSRRIALPIALALLAAPSAPRLASAQFQSCNFCDVFPFTPDPFDVDACDVGSIIINGAGFKTRSNNGCSVTPVDNVRSTRTDRVVITSFTVLSDTQIRMDYQVPCSATSGIVGIDVTIDDNPSDTIVPYACGNARMLVHEQTLSVSFAAAAARVVSGGIEVTWSTFSESGTLGFAVWAHQADGTESAHPRLLEAEGPGASYKLVDSRPEARTAVSYRVVEIRDDGLPGDGTQWLAVDRIQKQIGGRARATRRTR